MMIFLTACPQLNLAVSPHRKTSDPVFQSLVTVFQPDGAPAKTVRLAVHDVDGHGAGLSPKTLMGTAECSMGSLVEAASRASTLKLMLSSISNSILDKKLRKEVRFPCWLSVLLLVLLLLLVCSIYCCWNVQHEPCRLFFCRAPPCNPPNLPRLTPEIHPFIPPSLPRTFNRDRV